MYIILYVVLAFFWSLFACEQEMIRNSEGKNLLSTFILNLLFAPITFIFAIIKYNKKLRNFFKAIFSKDNFKRMGKAFYDFLDIR